METGAEAITLRTLIGWLVLAFIVTAIGTPIALWVGPTDRALVVQLAGAFFAAVVIWRLVIAARGAMEVGRPSLFDLAQRKPTALVEADPSLTQIATEVRASLRQRFYFVRVLWPRFKRLAGERNAQLPLTMPPPLGRPVKDHELAAILTAIEGAR